MDTETPIFPSTISSGSTISCWLKTPLPNLSFFKLQEHLTTDVVIIGGGIAGLTCAYKLVSEGKNVVLLEDGNLASGETGRTSAHLSNGKY
jgi:NADPH-dependent 2,4-dienoyl-CoA reductase/sulfur reductase-like enzyme